jgi:hypothetical protein
MIAKALKSRNGNTLTQIVVLSVGGLDAHLIPQNVQLLEQNKEITDDFGEWQINKPQ